MIKRHYQKVVIGLMVMLLSVSAINSFGQRRDGARELPRRRNFSPLSDKENPLMIGRRNINRRQINFFSRQREIALGQQFAAEVDRQAPLLNDPVISEYVNRVGQNLVLHSDAADVPFTIKVVASDEVNAFALPGGFFYVNTGVLRTADSESELAGVMAHEIAHVAARHAMENISKAQLLSYGSVPLIFLGGGLGELARSGANLGLSAALFSFSRQAEQEADTLGAQYLWAASYDPNGLVTFFEKLQAGERRPAISPLFRTHPATPDRIAVVRQLITRFPERSNSITSSSDFTRAKAHLLALSGGGRQLDEVAQSGRHRRVLRRPADGQADDASAGSSSTLPTASSPPNRPTLRRRPSSADGAAPAPPEPPTSAPADENTLGRDRPTLRRRPSPAPPDEDASSSTPEDQAGSPRPPVLQRRSLAESPAAEEPRQPPELHRRSPADPPAEKRRQPPPLHRRRP